MAARVTGGAAEDREKAFTTSVSAFRADPVERWLYPDERAYDESVWQLRPRMQ